MISEPRTPRAPRWMSRWLAFAGFYNLGWGGVMILLPERSLRWLGVAPVSSEVWPQLWACIGMIIGVYGVGYLIASRDPLRHWPIVLVGLLGKLLGPIGFIRAAWLGELPWSMGWTILTNDLLWWAPFAMILWHAARAHQAHGPSDPVSIAHAFDTLRDESGRTLAESSRERPLLLVLLRHAGCTFCKEAIADLAHDQGRLTAAGVRIALVTMSPTTPDLRAHADRLGLRDAAIFADPDRLAYRALELSRGGFAQLFGPAVWWPGLRATLRGHLVGRLQGDGFQMPGVALVEHGRITKVFRHATVADRPDYVNLACPIVSVDSPRPAPGASC